MRRKCREDGQCFEQLLNIDEGREAEISTMGMEVRGSSRVPGSNVSNENQRKDRSHPP